MGTYFAHRKSEPYLSVVAVSRNDDHGTDLLTRMQIFVNACIAQAIRHAIRCELVLVEWNPPPDRPPLRDALTWPDDHDWCPVRIITVPPALHGSFAYSDRLPLFQMIAKNVGIRRAQGQFVLATNIDILLSDPLMAFLAQRRLLRGCLYRSDRIDVDRHVPVQATIDAQLAYCQTHVLRANRPDGTRFTPPDGSPHTVEEAVLLEEDFLWRNASGKPAPHLWLRKKLRRTSFGRLMFRLPLWRMLKEKGHVLPGGRHTDRHTTSAPHPLFAHGLASEHSSCHARSFTNVITGLLWPLLLLPDLHLNACGDFTLMARETWFDIGGNPELEMFSLHLDSLALYNAHAHSVREIRLLADMIHYHFEHERGWTPESGRKLYERLQSLDIPFMTQGLLAKFAHDLGHGHRTRLSGPEWGLANYVLPETHIAGSQIVQASSTRENRV